MRLFCKKCSTHKKKLRAQAISKSRRNARYVLRLNSSRHRILIPLFLIPIVLVFNYGFVYGQPSTPPPPEENWNPPNEGKTGGQSHYEMAGWSSTDTLIIWTADIQGNPKSTFDIDEGVYLYVDTPINWPENRIWLYEYRQSGTSSGRWIFWMRLIGFGRFRFGPFYPDESQPIGNYTWKVWILNIGTGEYQEQVLSTNIIPEFPNPALAFVIVLFLAFFSIRKEQFRKYGKNQYQDF